MPGARFPDKRPGNSLIVLSSKIERTPDKSEFTWLLMGFALFAINESIIVSLATCTLSNSFSLISRRDSTIDEMSNLVRGHLLYYRIFQVKFANLPHMFQDY